MPVAGTCWGFERSLEQARARAAAAVGSDDAPCGLCCTSAYLGMQEATAWIELGKPGRAVMVFERDLAGLPVSDQVDAGVCRARLARAYAQDGRADLAASTALSAWDIACATGSRRAINELARVRRSVGSQPEIDAVARFIAVFDAHARQARTPAGRRPVR